MNFLQEFGRMVSLIDSLDFIFVIPLSQLTCVFEHASLYHNLFIEENVLRA